MESDSRAVACIQDNLKAARLGEQAVVMHGDALTALKRLEGKYRFDYLFMDPPYDQGLERQVLEYLQDSRLIDKESTLIIEASLKTGFDYLESMGFVVEKVKEYKTNRHLFVYRRE